ncbi:MAG TPA: hypothetical protein VGN61_14310 [Verrucomicrobiae bacterium]
MTIGEARTDIKANLSSAFPITLERKRNEFWIESGVCVSQLFECCRQVNQSTSSRALQNSESASYVQSMSKRHISPFQIVDQNG